MTRGLVRVLGATPEGRRRLAEAAGMSDAALAGPLSEARALTLWQVAPEVSGDVDLGLHFAEGASLEDLGIVGYLGRASATFGEACARVVKFQRLFKAAAELELALDADGATLIDVPPPGGPPWPRALAEAVIASWLIWPRRWSGTACRPTRVRLQHPRPERTDEHARVFGCPVEFGAARNELRFARDVWTLPLETADALLARYLESAAFEELRRLEPADPFVERVARVMVDLMPSGEVAAERVAKAVGVSARTLHRRLLDRGLTYQRLLDEQRRHTALALLQRNDHNVSEVAFLVGFSDPSGFRRAFRRWTGRAPRAFKSPLDRAASLAGKRPRV